MRALKMMAVSIRLCANRCQDWYCIAWCYVPPRTATPRADTWSQPIAIVAAAPPPSPRCHRLAGHTQLAPDLLDRDPQGGHVLIVAADGRRERPPCPVRPRVGARGQRLRRPADLQLIAPVADGSLDRRGGCCAVAGGKPGAVAVVGAAGSQSGDDQAGESDRQKEDRRRATSDADLRVTRPTSSG